MRVVLVNNALPFIHGGAEIVVSDLEQQLLQHGHHVELVRVPFVSSLQPEKILQNMYACRLFEIDRADRVIAFKFPVFYIKHQNKILWLIHQFRQVYDLWSTPFGYRSSNEARTLKNIVELADNRFLPEARKIYTISKVTTDRLKTFNGIDSEVLYPPLTNPERYHCGHFDDYVFFPSRITDLKRQHLAIEAMRFCRSKIKLVIAGRADSVEDLQRLQRLVARHHLDKRVQILAQWISEEEKVTLLANALACLYIPYDEDYGIVSLEACYSKKCIISCTDSGGPTQFVENGVNGFLSPPEPEALASVLDELHADKVRARKMGQVGYEKILSLNINWERVIDRLTK